MKLLEIYLLYLHLQERQWDEPTQNPDSFNKKHFRDLIGKLGSLDVFKKMRHSLQPSLYNIYIKNVMGDYLGRLKSMNSKAFPNIGFDEFRKDLNNLIKKKKYAEKIKDNPGKNMFKTVATSGEPDGP